MKTIKVLGGGCAKCQATQTLIETVAQEKGQQVEIIKVDDYQQILGYGVMSTPGVVIDETVVHRGSVPKRDEVEAWLD